MLNTSLVVNAVVHLLLCMLVKVFLGSIFDDLFLKKKDMHLLECLLGLSCRYQVSLMKAHAVV